MLRRTARRFSEVTEIVLCLACIGFTIKAAQEDQLDLVLLGVVCLALLGFEFMNKRYGGVR